MMAKIAGIETYNVRRLVMRYAIKCIKSTPLSLESSQVKTIRGYEMWCDNGYPIFTDINEAYKERIRWDSDTTCTYIVEEKTE